MAKTRELTEAETKLMEQICSEPGCYNGRERGYVVCTECLHGTAEKAATEAIALKKRLERERGGVVG
jgi:hypothetical protein